MNRHRGIFAFLIILAGATSVVSSAHAAAPASDNASDPAYTGGNFDGVNGGFGFGAWQLNQAVSTSSSGWFVGSSTNNAGGSSGGIDSTGAKSWGGYGNNGASALAVRPFTGDLDVGQTFAIDIDSGWIGTGAAVGLSLRNSAGQNLVKVFYRGGDATDSYKLNDGAGSRNLGVPFTGNGLHLEITLGAGDTYSGTLTAAGGAPVIFAGTLMTRSGGEDVTQVRLFNNNAAGTTGGANWDAFFNNMEIQPASPVVPEPSTIVLVGVGLAGALMIRRRKA
jgi:hypothetical protein